MKGLKEEHIISYIRLAFFASVTSILFWTLHFIGVFYLPSPNSSGPHPFVGILIALTVISFALCPITIIGKFIYDKKNCIPVIISVLTLLAYLPLIIQQKSHTSPICSCMDEYLIPLEIEDYFLGAAMILTPIYLAIAGYYSFHKEAA